MKLLPGNLALNFVDFFQGMRVLFFFFFLFTLAEMSEASRSLKTCLDQPSIQLFVITVQRACLSWSMMRRITLVSLSLK